MNVQEARPPSEKKQGQKGKIMYPDVFFKIEYYSGKILTIYSLVVTVELNPICDGSYVYRVSANADGCFVHLTDSPFHSPDEAIEFVREIQKKYPYDSSIKYDDIPIYEQVQ